MIRMVQLTSLDSIPGHAVDQYICSEKKKKTLVCYSSSWDSVSETGIRQHSRRSLEVCECVREDNCGSRPRGKFSFALYLQLLSKVCHFHDCLCHTSGFCLLVIQQTFGEHPGPTLDAGDIWLLF